MSSIGSESSFHGKRQVSRAAMSVALCLFLFTAPLQYRCLGQSAAFKPKINQTVDGISYVSAGIGYDSRVNLPRFSLKMVFATKNRSYLASIDIEITPGPKGGPVRIHSDGPWLLVDLVPGRYHVKARTSNGQELHKDLEIVKGQLKQLDMIWDISDKDI